MGMGSWGFGGQQRNFTLAPRQGAELFLKKGKGELAKEDLEGPASEF